MDATVTEDRNTTGIWSDSRRAPYEISRLEREKLLHNMVFRESYVTNTQKEDLSLEFVDSFRSQFVQLYPNRPPLLLTPLNELGVRKVICTFLKPSELPFEELYDLKPLATFLAHYIRFEELDDKTALPLSVVSPTTTMSWQVGNCLEMALVLCSALLGTGYDAYVVVGYASEDVTSNMQSNLPWPDKLPVEKSGDEEHEKQIVIPDKYTIKRRPNLESKFDAQRQREHDAAMRGEELPEANRSVYADEDVEFGSIGLDGNGIDGADVPKLVHCWVLIRGTGKRDIKENIFVEPSTGAIVPVVESSYVGITTIFNHHNCWVNMQDGVAIKDMNFDVRSLVQWENVFLTDPMMGDPENGDDGTGGGGGGPNDTTRGGVKSYDEMIPSDPGESGDRMLDVPVSWVAPLTLSQQQYESRYPGKRKKIEYHDATVEYFAPYSETDLKTMRVTMTDDWNNTHVHTFYKFREDRLRRFSVYPTKEEFNSKKIEHEWFDPGRKKQDQVRAEALRELEFEDGVQRTMRFYWKAREDGLRKRVEKFQNDPSMTTPVKIMEYYSGRAEDRVVYRSATYPPITEVNLGINSAVTGAANDAPSDADIRIPLKMAEKFERDATIPAEKDVWKRTFIKPQDVDGEIWVFYHYGENQITRPFRMYPRSQEKDSSGDSPRVKMNLVPFVTPPKKSQLLDELRVLLVKEKMCLAIIRRNTTERREILEHRSTQKKEHTPVYSVYDTLRCSSTNAEAEAEDARQEERRRQEANKDYLAPYIAQLVAENATVQQAARTGQPIKFTPQQIQEIREKALGELKDRLIRRAQIMQGRLEEERERLAKRQATFQKSQEMSDNARDHEDFLSFCEQATSRIRIFERRLEKHQEQALKRYTELDGKLRADERLRLDNAK
eukprot:PhM_4_TR5364/c0_g1_i1/m.29133